jgi:diguanylate cyclase (GGDEF)-like protein/PAS domain S-box-containing protein
MKTVAQLLAEENKSYLNTDLTAPNLMITKILATMNDSLERELVLREENRQLRSMYKALMDNDQYGILIADLDGTVMEFNRTAENLLGQKARHIVGSHVRNIPEIGEYIGEVLNDEKRFENIQVLIGNKLDQATLLDTFPMYDENSKLVGAFAQLHDITEAYRIHEQFNYLANHDENTGLPNRKFIKTKLADFMKAKKSNQGKGGLAVIHFSLDRFKIVNDTLGYSDGTQALKRIAKRLEISLEPTEFIARVGGDEFIVVAPCEDGKEIFQIGERFHSLFNEPFVMKGYEFHITASVGIAMYPDDGSTSEELLFKADTAMS